ncbi:MAG: FAD-dependent thymidylate synthase [Candidatus Mcinerneyibacterium aminivorans]|uniref:FAD-dependent thymidylate synthase n=1 Tax=Candidatus Mcinerneyibacterium aminivorans TaxID=2703815 RepID=A0A5D0MD31_9BACT|nr:MAG: FAD-dependent thymidylate synthase [Candidatus Mcinerneyibacterium aminivorans]
MEVGMKVKLAGLNIDYNLIKDIKGLLKSKKDSKKSLKENVLTPETLSAAYARISRSPLSVDELRQKAIEKVDKARKSNKKIVYDMGHGSIAEHAVFNIDLINVSRLASEYIQHHRLVSFTEKSQRYIKLEKDYIIPDEIKDDKDLVIEFKELIDQENQLYSYFYKKLMKYFSEKYPDMSKRKVQSKAKEDSRYILSLATTSQMGMTVNARNLEYMLRMFKASKIFEIQQLGKKLYELINPIVPSLILFNEPSEYDCKEWKNNFDYNFEEPEQNKHESVNLLNYDPEGEDEIIAGLLYQDSNYSFNTIMNNIKKVDKKEVLNKVWKNVDFYNRMDRAFEMANATFEFLLSSSAFAQLKRHRMSTQLKSDYDPALSVTIPSSIEEIGEEEKFLEMIDKIENFYQKIKKYDENAANYVLTNSHRRRVVMKANLREWYHFARLRSDKHAQWEIRALSYMVEDELKKIYPETTKIMMGKDKFKEKEISKNI